MENASHCGTSTSTSTGGNWVPSLGRSHSRAGSVHSHHSTQPYSASLNTMTYTDNLHMGSSASVLSSSAAAPAHLNPATDPLNLLQNPQMAVCYLPDQMQSHSVPQSCHPHSGRSTPPAANPHAARSAPALLRA